MIFGIRDLHQSSICNENCNSSWASSRPSQMMTPLAQKVYAEVAKGHDPTLISKVYAEVSRKLYFFLVFFQVVYATSAKCVWADNSHSGLYVFFAFCNLPRSLSGSKLMPLGRPGDPLGAHLNALELHLALLKHPFGPV